VCSNLPLLVGGWGKGGGSFFEDKELMRVVNGDKD
jgi:hypothetical protein